MKRAISSVPWQGRKVLCASIEPILGVFLYGRLLWCGYVVTVSNRDCDSLSLGSIPSSHPKEVLVVWRRRMRTGFISRGGWIDTNYNHQTYPVRQVGKASDFDSDMRWFESIRGCQVSCKKENNVALLPSGANSEIGPTVVAYKS